MNGWKGSKNTPVHENGLAVSPTVVEVFDKCLHARNGRFPRRYLHRVVWWGKKLEVVQCVVQPVSKVADVGHEQADRYVLHTLQKLL